MWEPSRRIAGLLLAAAGAISSLALLLIAAIAAGIGQGLVFPGGLAAVNQAAPEARRADVLCYPAESIDTQTGHRALPRWLIEHDQTIHRSLGVFSYFPIGNQIADSARLISMQLAGVGTLR
jgi:hypothetical protein